MWFSPTHTHTRICCFFSDFAFCLKWLIMFSVFFIATFSILSRKMKLMIMIAMIIWDHHDDDDRIYMNSHAMQCILCKSISEFFPLVRFFLLTYFYVNLFSVCSGGWMDEWIDKCFLKQIFSLSISFCLYDR